MKLSPFLPLPQMYYVTCFAIIYQGVDLRRKMPRMGIYVFLHGTCHFCYGSVYSFAKHSNETHTVPSRFRFICSVQSPYPFCLRILTRLRPRLWIGIAHGPYAWATMFLLCVIPCVCDQSAYMRNA